MKMNENVIPYQLVESSHVLAWIGTIGVFAGICIILMWFLDSNEKFAIRFGVATKMNLTLAYMLFLASATAWGVFIAVLVIAGTANLLLFVHESLKRRHEYKMKKLEPGFRKPQ